MSTVRRGPRWVLIAAASAITAVLLVPATLGYASRSDAAPKDPGHGLGHKAEHGQAINSDVSAPLRDIKPARHVAQGSHPDSPMPTPAGPVVADPVVQQGRAPAAAPATATNFDGIGANGSAPSDANGAVGPNHYFDLVNARLQIFDKAANSVLGPEATNTLWSGFGGECASEDNGDGTVRYDALADRWIVSQFALGPANAGPFYQCVAVSTTADPTGSYYRYSFGFANFPDYPKMGVWPDGYYQTMNIFNASGAFLGAETCAYDRVRMINGQAAGVQCFNLSGTAYGSFLPGDVDGTAPPPAGAPNTQIGLGSTNTTLASLQFHVDWSNSNNSSLTETDVPVAAYTGACAGGGACIPQVGTTQQLDSLADRMMYRFAYRNFGDHESWVVTYSVTAAGVAAPRWFELRRSPPGSGAITEYQDSTYAPDGNYRWMGSAAMDQSGNIALGYSESSSAMDPAIAYTGHQPSDGLNIMEPETVLMSGGGAQTGSVNRWGDYTAMTPDPSNGCTFWYTNQYIPANGSFNWLTRIGSFAFPSCVPRSDSDFSVALFPTTGTSPSPGSVTTTVSSGRTAGTAQSIALSATGLPAGVTAAFSPTSVTAGQATSTMTLTVAAGAAPGSYPIEVNAMGTSTSHLATFTLNVAGPLGTAIVNGGFESGDLTGWTSIGTTSVASGSAHSGSYSAQIGSPAVATNGDSSISQTFQLAAPATLSLWYNLTCPDTVAYDWATVTLTDSTINATTTVLAKTCVASSGWINVTDALGSSGVGHVFTLTLTSHDDNYPTDPTATKYDDISLVPIPAADFSISASPPSQTVVAGAGTSYTATVTPTNGFNSAVGLSVSGLPGGANFGFTPTTVTGSGSSTLTITTSTGTPPGTYPLTVSGLSGSLSHSVGVTLVVNPAPPQDFSISVSPPSQTVVAGAGTSYTGAVKAVNGFSGSVALTIAGLPSGASGAFSPNPIASSGGTTLSVTTSSSTPPGTYPLTVTGTSGTLVHTAGATLIVQAAPLPSFTLTVSPSNQSVRRSGQTTYTITVTPTGSVVGTVTLSLAGLPSGASAAFRPISLTSGTSTLTVTAGSTTGTFTIIITGTSGSVSHSAGVTLTVKH